MSELDLKLGLEIRFDELPPITRTQLALYAGGSNDHTPVHIDSDSARAHGFPDVFAQGMFVMGLLGRSIVQRIPQSRLKEFHARFVARTYIGDRLTCTATVTERHENEDSGLQLSFADQNGKVKVLGRLLVSPPGDGV
jgi:acyl dehydratase